MAEPLLFQPITIRGVELKNRIVASPMWQYRGVGGHSTDWHLMHLGRLSDGGAGLVFQEGTAVERRGCGTVGDLGLWSDEFIPGLRRIVNLVRANGAVPGLQLMHAGRKGRQRLPADGRGPLQQSPEITDWDGWEIVGASAIGLDDHHPIPRALTTAEVQNHVQAWVEAARRATQIGYEVLELHAAHGYLLHQFLSAATNRRRDRYGGSFANRARLLTEILEGVRTVWPDDKPVFVRLSCVDTDGWSIEDSVRLVNRLKPLGVDLIDCTSGGIYGPLLPSHVKPTYGYQAPYAQAVRYRAQIRTCAVGLVVHAEQAEAILTAGSADLVALARELLYNPNWPIDAAQKLDADPTFAKTAPRLRYWLAKRAADVEGFVPSTFSSPR
ncbi:NADH:flavin oxidoreductase/NADH oxidase [Phenylobacterium sp.]|jgi:2,4-dienoyl-CoA reductase-like NADH-dependent reductase (Old Yellow Enzyme family)|uniref:NADH:flavin oxidoreductase/NADH oxidase n=1 Tax=Phenylobacterium sp. TaxID=1871053 RepID=UPI002E2FECD1|nr:NADH:flavin oxidoreductase/NADH oxidase [Phenylobacterium sp.]HEX3364646.1 NADH:flavin oxidoreductase/NADH oxidase [Phenylobacterium sp.]